MQVIVTLAKADHATVHSVKTALAAYLFEAIVQVE